MLYTKKNTAQNKPNTTNSIKQYQTTGSQQCRPYTMILLGSSQEHSRAELPGEIQLVHLEDGLRISWVERSLDLAPRRLYVVVRPSVRIDVRSGWGGADGEREVDGVHAMVGNLTGNKAAQVRFDKWQCDTGWLACATQRLTYQTSMLQ